LIAKYVKERGYEGKDPSLTIGKEYLVFRMILNSINSETTLSLPCDDDNELALFNLKNFEIIDNRLPEGWGFFALWDGCYSLEPCAFRGDFWDLYYEGEPSEVTKLLQKYSGQQHIDPQAIFKEEERKLKLLHGIEIIEEKSIEPEDPYAWPFGEYK